MTLTLRYWFKHFRCIYNKGALWNTTCPSSADRPCSRTSTPPTSRPCCSAWARKRTVPKGSYLFRVGDRTTAMGIMLEGSVRLEKEDYWGNRSILASFGPGQSFAEVYACEPDLAFDINVVAAEDATVLFLDIGRVTTMCPSSCAFHARLIRNLLGIVAKRTHALTRKIEHTTKRTTRAKLLSYLSDQAEAAHASRFVIPFDRQELADYLSVDRSAMCAELSRMKRDGLIDYNRNQFEIVRRSAL